MGFFDEVRMYARFARKLPGFLARRDTVEGGRAILEDRLANREGNFLRLAERAIYGQPHSPYLPLLRRAGCELGDLRQMVRRDGLESALHALHRAGVVVRFEQFKGREPLQSAGDDLTVRPGDFDNPFLKKHLEMRSSGSTGTKTRTPIDLDCKAAQSPVQLLVQSAQGILGLPNVRIKGTLPESPAFGGALTAGTIAERWFVPVLSPPRTPELRFRIAHHSIVAMARLYGVPVPRPEPLRMDGVVTVARWAGTTLRSRQACVIHCSSSMALRVSIAAREAGIDLTGAIFRCGGEPLTRAKMDGIRATGASAFANYNMTEVGMVGAGCTRPLGVNDQHLMTDHLAVIQAPRQVGGSRVDALLLTTLLTTARRILLNVEIDDFGIIEERSCGCPLDDLGLHTHVRDVRSFGKLTAEAVTLVGSEMEHVLETVLPARFGGTSLDYQLAEEEDEQGFTRICLYVSPSVQIEDESALVAAVLEGLSTASISTDLAARLWNQAGAFRVRRIEPHVGARGKVLPLYRDRGQSKEQAGVRA